MKTVLRLPPSVSNWFADGTASDVLRSCKFSLAAAAIMQCESTISQLREELMSANTSAASKQYLEAILTLGVFDGRATPKNVDFSVSETDLYTHITLGLVNEINELSALRAQAFSSGESRESLYKRTLHVPASLASRIVILDPYAGTAVCDDDVDRLWLLRRLRQSGCKSIHIVTAIPKGDNKNVGDLKPFRRKERILAGLAILARELGCSITADIYKPNSREFHNRRLHFQFSHGSLGCLLEKGIDGFANNQIEPGSAIKPLNGEEIKEALKVTEKLFRV